MTQDTYDFDELLGALPASSPPAPLEVRVGGGAGRESMIAGDAFEGASRVSQELASFTPAIRSPDKDLAPAKPMADSRARNLTQNDANLQSGVRLRQDAVVGAHFMLNARPNSRRLFGEEDVVWEDEHAEEVEEYFSADAESDDCWLDASGRMTFTQMVRMAVEQHTVYGETLSTVEWLRDRGRPFSTAIQMIDLDRLSTPLDKVGDPNISMGVQTNAGGRAIGYHIRMAHPSDWQFGADALRWKYVPAHMSSGRKQVMHLYTPARPGQSRGIGTMVAAIPEMKMARQFREIVLQNAILNATYAATIESDQMDPRNVFAALGGVDAPPEAVQSAMENMMGGYYRALNTLMGGSSNLKMGGIKIPFLPPGTKLSLQGAGQGGPLGSEFEASLNRVMASALGISYEQFSRDYTKTNYSSGKMASVETYKAMLSIKRGVADSFASTIYRLWYEEMLNRGVFTTLRRSTPSFYEGRNREWYTACDWIGSSRGQVDELKETQAAVLRVNNGVSTLQDENARLGKDWRKQMRQLKRESDWKKFYGILQDVTDTTNQENAVSGTKREAGTGAHTPSPGTAENLFMDSEHPDEPEAVNE